MKFNIFIIIYLYLIKSSKSFLFSIIISIYNTEKYLQDSINSLLKQSIGFKEIQIILINDGSTDKSDEICESYKKKYPINIVYIKINHMGVSKARNIGLKYAKGNYINFLDSDDKWDENAFKYVLLFLNLYKNIDILSCRIKYFESSEKYHFLDYKFKNTRIVNLDTEYYSIQLHASSSFIRYSSIKKINFDESLFYGEDAKFISNILFNKRMLGLIRESIYYYRKRADSSSAIQKISENVQFYFDILKNLHIYLIKTSIELFQKILPFIQFYLAYEILFRLTSQAFKFLDSNSYKKYCLLIKKILLRIDDKYILEQRIFSSQLKILALSQKYSRDIRYDLISKNSNIIYSNYIMINFTQHKNIIIWKIIDIKENILHLEGEDRSWLPRSNYFYFCKFGYRKFSPYYYDLKSNDFDTLYGTFYKGRLVVFDILLNLTDKQIIQFYISFNNNIIEIFPSLEYLNHLPPINNSYYIKENYIIKNYNNKIYVYKNLKEEKSFEINFSKELTKLHKNYLIELREKYFNWKNIVDKGKKNQIWLINDSIDKARDNGEYFFNYLNKIKPKMIKYYFVISKNSSDFKRLKLYNDNIIDYNSTAYLNLFLKADKIITSVAETWTINPLGKDGRYICDIYNFDYIYLKNGIIKDDISRFVNRIKHHFDLIIASSKKEYNSFLNKNYGYNKNNIALTGLPKYDNLKRLQKAIKKNKIILLIPTWRMYIKGTRDLIIHKSIKSESFRNTTYYNFYNDLINNKQLLYYMKMNNYKGIFCLHPNFEEQWSHFNQNELFEIKKVCDTQELVVKSSLLITDYSSIFFDFGYMEKPIIFTHFDYKEYRKNHFPEGYFDYKTEGFGKICYNLECTINEIIKEIKNNMHMKMIYRMRIKRFFKYFDDLNCYRTYISILEYNNKNKYKNIFNLNNIYILIILYILKIYL